jgi:hypothetical protein
VVVDPAGIASGEEGSHHVLVLARDGQEEVAVPVPGGVALLVDRAVAPGRWTLELESWTCNASGCGTETREGRPEDTDVTGPPQRCDVTVTVGAEPLVVQFGPPTVTDPACTATVVPEVPPLDVPTGWTARPPLPWSCGTGDVGHGALLDPLSRHAAKDARRCFLAAHEAGEPAELPSAEPRADRSLAPTYWRTDGSGAVEVVRPDGWTVQRCTGLVEAPPPEHMAATGCGPEEPL